MTRELVLGATDVAGGVAAVAAALTEQPGPLVVARAAVALPEPAVAELTGRGVTVTALDPVGPGPAVTVAHGHLEVVGAGPQRAIGWLVVADRDRVAAAAALAAAAPALSTATGDPFGWLLLALVRAGVPVRGEAVAPWPVATDGSVPAALSDTEERRIALLRANRSGDGWYSVTVLRRLSKPLTAWAADRGWSPNALTCGSLLVGLVAAALFATGSRWALVAGAVLLQASLVVDCSDGEVARLTGRFTAVGAWLDAVTDRVKEFAAYAGLAAGAVATGTGWAWWAAGGLIVLQTVRHSGDYTFEQVQAGWSEVVRRGRVTAADAAAGELPGPAVAATAGGAGTMVRRTLFLPIGERWLLLSLAAIVLGGAGALVLLLVVGGLSLGYATAGRAVRTRAWTRGPVATMVITRQLDTAPFGIPLPLGARSGTLLLAAAALGGVALLLIVAIVPVVAGGLLVGAALLLLGVRAALFRPAWAAPGALAAIEMLPWLATGAVFAPDAGAVTVGLLFVVAFHRYDLLYRAVAGSEPPVWLAALAWGAPVRLAVVAVLLVVATGSFAAVAAAVAVYWAIVMVVIASAQWLVSRR